ncbi:MAG: M48 family metalloprotease [Armatimonadota bacterium]|nr:M48 family metalloprotease [Armatimonadota bacterium]MCX7776864.1 M48 family metalloprotease [Armatimonadota bacterium]MDW8024450.1 M48 family metalloprotease [Armatimonadota bacterium]
MRPVKTAAILVTLILCASEIAFGIDLLTRELEIRIGKQAAIEVEQEYGGVIAGGAYVERLQHIGSKIAAVCPRKDVSYTFKVLNNEKLVNAISLPGGPVYVTKRLMDLCPTDDELAYVVGHEVAHIAMKHARKQISERLALGLVGSIFMPESDIVRVGVAVALTLHERGYSRSHEREADKYGVLYMMQAGYNPIGALKVLSMFLKMEGSKDGAFIRLLRTHPHPKERLKHVRAVISQHGSKYGFNLQAIEEQLKKEQQ